MLFAELMKICSFPYYVYILSRKYERNIHSGCAAVTPLKKAAPAELFSRCVRL